MKVIKWLLDSFHSVSRGRKGTLVWPVGGPGQISGLRQTIYAHPPLMTPAQTAVIAMTRFSLITGWHDWILAFNLILLKNVVNNVTQIKMQMHAEFLQHLECLLSMWGRTLKSSWTTVISLTVLKSAIAAVSINYCLALKTSNEIASAIGV